MCRNPSNRIGPRSSLGARWKPSDQGSLARYHWIHRFGTTRAATRAAARGAEPHSAACPPSPIGGHCSTTSSSPSESASFRHRRSWDTVIARRTMSWILVPVTMTTESTPMPCRRIDERHRRAGRRSFDRTDRPVSSGCAERGSATSQRSSRRSQVPEWRRWALQMGRSRVDVDQGSDLRGNSIRGSESPRPAGRRTRCFQRRGSRCRPMGPWDRTGSTSLCIGSSRFAGVSRDPGRGSTAAGGLLVGEPDRVNLRGVGDRPDGHEAGDVGTTLDCDLGADEVRRSWLE